MKRIDELFKLHRARSDIFPKYKPGNVPYVGNGMSDNSVIGLVTPLAKDKVFTFRGIAVSAFCEASIQAPPFVACGRAGNGMIVLEPKDEMTTADLAYYAAYINEAVRWRFSWYWQTTTDRLRRLLIPAKSPKNGNYPLRKSMPQRGTPTGTSTALKFSLVSLGSIYDLQSGHYHSLSSLSAGNIPVVSCGETDNGVCGYFDISDHIYINKLTIAFNGATLAAKYHPYTFAAKDDVAICSPKKPLRLATELFIQVMLERERWRFSYYRKCYKEKLARVMIPLPLLNGEIDEDAIESVMKSTEYWSYLRTRIKTGLQLGKAAHKTIVSQRAAVSR